MDRVVQIFCELLGDLGVATDSLQQECMQCLDSQSPEEQKALTDQFISQIRIVFPTSTEDKSTETEPDDDRPTKRLKKDHVSKHDVQITASKEELEKRIANFMALKAAQNVVSNEREFCTPAGSSKTNPATITRKKQIKLSKNESQEGPLNTTHSVVSADGTKKMHAHIKLPWGVEQRLQNLEHFTETIPPTPPDVYERLKALEDKLLLLEDTGFMEYLKKKAKTGKSKPGKSEPKMGNGEFIDSSSLAAIGSPPPVDANKRIAELVASLQKKSTEQANNANSVI
eukprot:Phypoly_transcript_12131.p1 GENE.Phypoly_transcript_12131~~Phypoly_transcript_12131.p1  ORF type:complete len:285 (+),score=53.06 Phypoly_transcript_12131:99-953(+)